VDDWNREEKKCLKMHKNPHIWQERVVQVQDTWKSSDDETRTLSRYVLVDHDPVPRPLLLRALVILVSELIVPYIFIAT